MLRQNHDRVADPHSGANWRILEIQLTKWGCTVAIFKTRRANDGVQNLGDRPPAVVDENDDPAFASIEGVTLERFVSFIARVSSTEVSALKHDAIAQELGFPAGRYDLIRNAWMLRVYNSPALAREFGERLDTERTSL